MALYDFEKEQARMRQSLSEALALRLELARQAETPLGVAHAEVEQLENECKQLNRRLGANALIDAQKIQAANPNMPADVAFNLASRGL